ncbi:MAG: YHYH protein [Actinomycetota bacterium]
MSANRSSLSVALALAMLLVAAACSSEPEPAATDVGTPDVTTAGDLATSANESATPADVTEVSGGCMIGVDSAIVTCDEDQILVESNGLPSHEMMVGIAAGAWNGQWPDAQDFNGSNAFVIPATIDLADDPALTVMNVAGVTANGIPFFFPHAPGRAGSDDCIELPDVWVRDGECLRDPVAVGEMDDCGGHTGRGDDYHYHAEPTCLIDQLEDGAIVGYMLDGVPIYAEPLPGSVEYEGCSGWISPDGVLHHAFQDTYPYLTDCMLGEFAEGPRTQGADVYTGGLDAPRLGEITGFGEGEDGCHTMTFADGNQLTHCH